MKDEKNYKSKINTTVEEAARLLKENPEWTFKQAIDKAKELTK